MEINKSNLLDGFIIRDVESTNLEYFGYNEVGTAFIQFRAGSTYFYKLDPLKHTEFLAGGFRKLTPIRKEFKKLITPKT